MDDPARREPIVRIVREAVTNAVRHGHAAHVSVCVSMEEGIPTLRVSDDGVGFDDSVTADSGRFGLVSMKERAARDWSHIGSSLGARRWYHRRSDVAVTTGPVVLIADDHAPTRALIRRVMEEDGFRVCAEVGNADEAIRIARESEPDVGRYLTFACPAMDCTRAK